MRPEKTTLPPTSVITALPCASMPAKGQFLLFDLNRLDINRIFYFRIDKSQIGGRPFTQCAEGDCKDSGRVARHLCDCFHGSEDAFAHEPQNERQGRFQTDHAICGIFEFQVLFNRAVRRMIRSNNIDGPIGKPGLYRLDVLGPPERWIDLVDRVEGRDQFFGKSKIMGCGLGADGQSPRFLASRISATDPAVLI